MKKILILLAISVLSINLFAQKVEDLPKATTYENTDLLIIDQSDATRGIEVEDLYTNISVTDSLNVSGESEFLDTVRIIKPMYIFGNLFNGTGIGSAAAGNTGEIQFNTSNIFNADPDLFWDNINKRLGIGTNTPLALLDINNVGESSTFGIKHDNTFTNILTIQDNAGENTFQISGSPTNGNSLIEFGDFTGVTSDISFTLDQSNSKYYFKTGNVGIGTITPSEKLHINGNILVQDTAKIDIISSSDDTLRIITHAKIDSNLYVNGNITADNLLLESGLFCRHNSYDIPTADVWETIKLDTVHAELTTSGFEFNDDSTGVVVKFAGYITFSGHAAIKFNGSPAVDATIYVRLMKNSTEISCFNTAITRNFKPAGGTDLISHYSGIDIAINDTISVQARVTDNDLDLELINGGVFDDEVPFSVFLKQFRPKK